MAKKGKRKQKKSEYETKEKLYHSNEMEQDLDNMVEPLYNLYTILLRLRWFFSIWKCDSQLMVSHSNENEPPNDQFILHDNNTKVIKLL